jgi:hypothetical protein
MELKSGARRARVFAAALALGLVIGAHGYFFSPTASGGLKKSAPNSPSGEEQQSPGEGTGLRPASPGKSLVSNVKAAQVAAPVGSELETAWKQSTIRMSYLESCEKSQTCTGFDTSEPYSYDLDVRRQTAREIEDFTKIANAWQAEHGGDFPEEAQKLARYFLDTGNDDVKEAALKLIELAPLSEANVTSAFGAVQTSTSGPLMTSFLKGTLAPAACADSSFASTCVSFIAHTVRIGGEGVQKALARNSLNIESKLTVASLAAAEKQSSPRSINRLMYRLNRQEFQRQERGG